MHLVEAFGAQILIDICVLSSLGEGGGKWGYTWARGRISLGRWVGECCIWVWW